MNLTAVQLEQQLATVLQTQLDDCLSDIAALPAEATTERKALMIRRGMYDFAFNAALLHRSADEETCRKYVDIKARRVARYTSVSPALKVIYDTLTEEERRQAAPYLCAVYFLKGQVLPNYRHQHTAAQAQGDVSAAFALGIKIAVLQDVLELWRTVWVNHGGEAWEI